MLHPLIHSFKKCLLSFHQNTTMLHTVDIQNKSFDTLFYTLFNSEYRECFSFFDKNGDGTITADELAVVIRSMDQNPTDQDIKDMMAKADLNSE